MARVDEAEPPADRLIELGLNIGWGPVGETEAARFTEPEKPLTLFTVIVAVVEEP